MHQASERNEVLLNLPEVVVQRVPSEATKVSGRSFCVTTLRVRVGALSPLRSGMAQPASNAAVSDTSMRTGIPSL